MSEFIYQGTDVLENLQEAKNYNKALTNFVLKTSNKGKTLDFGAGIGTFAESVRELLNPSCFEIDSAQVDILKSKGFKTFRSFEEIDEQYSFIYSLNVFEHIEEDHEVAKKLTKLLLPGGKMFIFVPAFSLLYSDFDQKVGHVRRYSTSMLKECFAIEGLNISKAKYYDTVGFVFALIFKLLNFSSDKASKRNIKIFDRIFFPLNKILDPIFGHLIGKNAYVIVEKSKS